MVEYDSCRYRYINNILTLMIQFAHEDYKLAQLNSIKGIISSHANIDRFRANQIKNGNEVNINIIEKI